ncbi:hypothetical protein LOK49_LG13G01479 [Camellia lanceoleosa]|uniref:Uncharacterized protein n=1 Tax=Camellia lanceoleosa TaxID=1840588 RepID=A0ACC0FLL6_9ERIC|nr:hypothetical protein LOK49_LG13G01479 [Camellia lanceoleosa]
MASRCNRFINRTSISSLKSAIKSNLQTASASSSSSRFPLPTRSTSSPLPRFSLSRSQFKSLSLSLSLSIYIYIYISMQLYITLYFVFISVGAWMRAVSVASPQCSSFCKDDIVPELVFKELQSSLSGHMSFHCLKDIYWDFTRPANYDSLHHSQSLVNQCRGDVLADHLTTRKCCLQAIGMARRFTYENLVVKRVVATVNDEALNHKDEVPDSGAKEGNLH